MYRFVISSFALLLFVCFGGETFARSLLLPDRFPTATKNAVIILVDEGDDRKDKEERKREKAKREAERKADKQEREKEKKRDEQEREAEKKEAEQEREEAKREAEREREEAIGQN